METNDKLVSVYTGNSPGQANVAQEALEAAGIKAFVSNSFSHGIMGMATESVEGGVSVSVAEQDVAAAQEILAELTADPDSLIWNKAEQEAADQATEEDRISNKTIVAWPHCPECEKPRVTVCPICSTSGSEFPRAHENFGVEEEGVGIATEGATENSAEPSLTDSGTVSEEGAEPKVQEQRLAIVCTTCDEPWMARFLRKCEWCGHDFGAGLKVDVAPQHREPAEPLNPRAIFLLLLIGGLLGGVFLWFWLLGK